MVRIGKEPAQRRVTSRNININNMVLYRSVYQRSGGDINCQHAFDIRKSQYNLYKDEPCISSSAPL